MNLRGIEPYSFGMSNHIFATVNLLWQVSLRADHTIDMCSSNHIARKGVPVPTFLRHLPLDPSWTSILKSLFPLPSFLFHPPFKVFQTVPLTLTRPLLTFFWHNNLPLTKLTRLNKYQKCHFTSSTVAFYRKLIFNFLNSFKNISGYLNSWNIFRLIFTQLRMTFTKSKGISKCKSDKP